MQEVRQVARGGVKRQSCEEDDIVNIDNKIYKVMESLKHMTLEKN
jgi:hypothetical protein